MTFKNLKFDESPVMREFGRLALKKGWITEKTEAEQTLEKFASTKVDKIFVSENLDQNVLTLISRLRQSNLTSLACELEEKYFLYKKATKDVDSKIVEQAHKNDDDELVKNIMDRHLEIMKVVEKEPKRTSGSLIHQVKLSLAAPNFKVELLKAVDYYMNGMSHLLNNVFDEQLKQKESVKLAAMFNNFKKLKEDVSAITNPFVVDEWLASELDQQAGFVRYYLQNLQVPEPVKKKLDSTKLSYFDMADKTISNLKKQKESLKDIVLDITALRSELSKGLKNLKEEYNNVLNNKDVDQNTKAKFSSLVKELTDLNLDLYKRYSDENQIDSIYWREFSGLFKNNYPNLKQYFVQINDAGDVAAIMTKMLGDLTKSVKKSYINVIHGIEKIGLNLGGFEISNEPTHVQILKSQKQLQELQQKQLQESTKQPKLENQAITDKADSSYKLAAKKYLEAALKFKTFLNDLDDDKFLDYFDLKQFSGLNKVFSDYLSKYSVKHNNSDIIKKSQLSFISQMLPSVSKTLDLNKDPEKLKAYQEATKDFAPSEGTLPIDSESMKEIKKQILYSYDPEKIKSLGNKKLISDIANNIRQSFDSNIIRLNNIISKKNILLSDLEGVEKNLNYYFNIQYGAGSSDLIDQCKNLMIEGNKLGKTEDAIGGQLSETVSKHIKTNAFDTNKVKRFVNSLTENTSNIIRNIMSELLSLKMKNPKEQENSKDFRDEIYVIKANFEQARNNINEINGPNISLSEIVNAFKQPGLEDDFSYAKIKSLEDISTIANNVIKEIKKTFEEYKAGAE